ncbi:MAG: L,D-transpeptidase family protein, partial [Thermoanaerobaculia bacterium]|nr:L,D-transpeptidase family protein [Thermoanaerobaculia bacterium]
MRTNSGIDIETRKRRGKPFSSDCRASSVVRSFLIILLFLTGCAEKPASPEAQNGASSIDPGSLEQYIESNAPGENVADARTKRIWSEIEQFYGEREYEPAWYRDGEFRSESRDLLDGFRSCAADESRVDQLGVRLNSDSKSAVELAAIEVLLTFNYLDCVRNRATGGVRVEPEEFGWEPKGSNFDGVAILEEALAGGTLVERLDEIEPGGELYQALYDYREILRDIVENGGWAKIPEGDTLEVGDTAPPDRITTLVTRLKSEGILEETYEIDLQQEKAVYDEPLSKAVKRFQRSYLLEADGLLGPGTVRALNVPAEERVKEVEVNLVRSTWLPDLDEGTDILVNIPTFRLEYRENGRTALQMDVIVGEDEWETPVLSGRLQNVVFNPDWNVPESIVLSEILPKVKEDPRYLQEEGFQVLESWTSEDPIDPRTIDWDSISADEFDYRLRKLPGPENPLGNVKFLFENDQNIYLHDTPADRLFEQYNRDLSHGCVRLSRPMDLARRIVPSDADEWHARDTAYYRVERPIDVHLVYLTMSALPDGSIIRHEDVYGRDGHLAEAIEN